MIHSKIGTFALLAALSLPLAASAQTAPMNGAQTAPNAAPAAPRHHHHHGGAYMKAVQQLQLSADQRAKIHTMVMNAQSAQQSAATPVDKTTRRADTVALRQQIEGVLSDTQRSQLHANLRAQRQAKLNGAPQAPQQQTPQ